ncbi:helix-turn-helix transcriptional regulator [Yinghuangia seranimata]|uniref:helix-turn-helix transcriptional regulator n=1 Tax=Yinghuangia seranimata TaxID=408067 RepID=UPI00248D1261|nr:helix-turn-helix domain-containing protein [Yinghuangia seranimata]MDI2129016.1 helix-turn-helix domain-containing protein [Yinghuangia seranimata]
MTRPAEQPARWTFLTSHARVLAAVADNPYARIRDIAEDCRLTERAVSGILSDLETAGYLSRTRVGRRTAYTVSPDAPLRHPADQERGRTVADTLGIVGADQRHS